MMSWQFRKCFAGHISVMFYTLYTWPFFYTLLWLLPLHARKKKPYPGHLEMRTLDKGRYVLFYQAPYVCTLPPHLKSDTSLIRTPSSVPRVSRVGELLYTHPVTVLPLSRESRQWDGASTFLQRCGVYLPVGALWIYTMHVYIGRGELISMTGNYCIYIRAPLG